MTIKPAAILLLAAVLAAITASLPAPYPIEETLIRQAGAGRDNILAPALVLHYLGHYGVWVVLSIAAAYLFAGDKRMAVFAVCSTALSTAITTLLKNLVDRTRPDILTHLVQQSDASFPSGHSTFAAALAMLFILRYPRAPVIAAGLSLTVAMGWSRLLLGVHYPLDVLAGWCVGLMAPLLVSCCYPPQKNVAKTTE